MKDFTKQSLKLIEEVQKELLDVEELSHPKETKDVEISKLIRPSYSRRQLIPNLLRSLIKSLHENDFVGGIFINRDFNVIDGWHRVEIWENMKNKTIPCFILDVSQEIELKLHLSLNRQVAQFTASDFGFTQDFPNLDLAKDYGFTRADLIPRTSPESKGKLGETNFSKKLITSIPDSYHEKMEVIKKRMQAPNKSQVLIKLIDFYENNNS